MINKDIVLHVTRFFPAGEMKNAKPTPVDTVYEMADIARKHLNYVYEGNV
jgi:pyruvate formate lyase activating enzyme